jgi:signal transduction histidine kinase
MRGELSKESADQLIGAVIARHRADILGTYHERLATSYGASLRKVGPDQLLRQAGAVLDEVRERLVGRHPCTPPPDGPGVDIDAGCAEPELHPGESLRTTGLLCESALTRIGDRLPEHPELTPGVIRLATTLNQVVLDRLATASVSYIGYLLDQLHRSHADERRRVARELHDLVAHSVAVALQNLELFELHRDRDPDRAAGKLAAALTGLRETLDTVRVLAHDLRRSAAQDGVQAALRAYLDDAPAIGMCTELRFHGDEAQIPAAVRGELFLILREALRNAHAHSGAGSVAVVVDVEPLRIRARVVDDGDGFDAATGRGTGLASIRERMALLGGVLSVTSAPGRGTAVQVDVPLMRLLDDRPR